MKKAVQNSYIHYGPSSKCPRLAFLNLRPLRVDFTDKQSYCKPFLRFLIRLGQKNTNRMPEGISPRAFFFSTERWKLNPEMRKSFAPILHLFLPSLSNLPNFKSDVKQIMAESFLKYQIGDDIQYNMLIRAKEYHNILGLLVLLIGNHNTSDPQIKQFLKFFGNFFVGPI